MPPFSVWEIICQNIILFYQKVTVNNENVVNY